jgi:hypothetical protein
MFDYHHGQGLGPGKWLYWLMGLAVVYAVASMFVDTERVGFAAGAIVGAVAVGAFVKSLWRK